MQRGRFSPSQCVCSYLVPGAGDMLCCAPTSEEARTLITSGGGIGPEKPGNLPHMGMVPMPPARTALDDEQSATRLPEGYCAAAYRGQPLLLVRGYVHIGVQD